MDDERKQQPAPSASHWVWNRLTEKSTWSGISLIVICSLVLLGLPIVKALAWLGLLYGIYSTFSAD